MCHNHRVSQGRWRFQWVRETSELLLNAVCCEHITCFIPPSLLWQTLHISAKVIFLTLYWGILLLLFVFLQHPLKSSVDLLKHGPPKSCLSVSPKLKSGASTACPLLPLTSYGEDCGLCLEWKLCMVSAALLSHWNSQSHFVALNEIKWP